MDIIKVSRTKDKGGEYGTSVALHGNLDDLEFGVSLAIKDIVGCAHDAISTDEKGGDEMAKKCAMNLFRRITASSALMIEEQLGFSIFDGKAKETEEKPDETEESGEDHGKDSGDESELNFGVAVLTKEELIQLLDSLAPASGKKKGEK